MVMSEMEKSEAGPARPTVKSVFNSEPVIVPMWSLMESAGDLIQLKIIDALDHVFE